MRCICLLMSARISGGIGAAAAELARELPPPKSMLPSAEIAAAIAAPVMGSTAIYASTNNANGTDASLLVR
jgi:hypothetical protein